jgi:hypothetical protein
MKNSMKNFILITLVGIFFLASCQEEVIDITNPIDGSTISADSPIVSLIKKTSMNDGSFDNILDNSSCTSIVLPVTVIANGVEVVINHEDDYELVEHIFDESDTDEDILEIVYPITVILADHTEVVVNNDAEFAELIVDCVEGGMDEDIECLDFVYPLKVSVYDGANQVVEVVEINNDEELYELFASLDAEHYLSFEFPLMLVLADGTEVIVNSNDELEKLIEEVGDDCDEDDDNDHDDDDIDDTELVTVLLDGDWVITNFDNGNENSPNFNDFIFDFFEDGTATATLGDNLTEGMWKTFGDDEELELKLDFGTDSPLNVLAKEWSVHEFEENIIKLYVGSEDEGEVTLTFERHQHDAEPTPTVAEFIIDGEWLVAKYNDSGVDETAAFNGFSFNFMEDGSVEATSDTETITGTWEEIIEADSHQFIIDMGEKVPFDELGDDWHVVSLTETRIELTHTNDIDDTSDTLVFEKL